MLKFNVIGESWHKATNHSYQSVQIDPNFVDPTTQPSVYKIYPKFYRRFPLEADHAIHEFIRLTSTITFKKVYKSGSYQLRINPSAGALYPTEIYLQIRGIRGMIDGIYHLEIATDSLTLIYELIDDGVEAYILPDRLVKGIIFLVSCAYFRSSWKYKRRSFRYCLLDSGHHLGAIEASAYLHQQSVQAIFNFDKVALNQALGFENKEWITAAMVSGEVKPRTVRSLRSPLPFVSPTDYFEPDLWIETAYQNTLIPDSPQCALRFPTFNFTPERYLLAVLNRRSARRFHQKVISNADYLELLNLLNQPLPTQNVEAMQIFWVVHRVEGRESGLYENDRLLKSGDFSEKAGYLCVNQAIARDSAVTLFFTASYCNYQTASQQAGWLAHRLYLLSDYLGLSCSGIGAYFDDETREFLGTPNDVLYALAIGI